MHTPKPDIEDRESSGETAGVDVFISYASEDVAVAREVARSLQQVHLSVWLDKHDLRGGREFGPEIAAQIERCRIFLPLLSKVATTPDKRYFRREWYTAVEALKEIPPGRPYIVTLRIDKTPVNARYVPAEFGRFQVVEFSSRHWVEKVRGAVAESYGLDPVRFGAEIPLRPSNTDLLSIDLPAERPLRANFLLRWGINRQSGLVVISGTDGSALKAMLTRFEAMFNGALTKATPRCWWMPRGLPILSGGVGELLTRLAAEANSPLDESRMIGSGERSLGLILEGNLLHPDLRQCLDQLQTLQQSLPASLLLVVAMPHPEDRRGAAMVAGNACPDGLPAEIVRCPGPPEGLTSSDGFVAWIESLSAEQREEVGPSKTPAAPALWQAAVCAGILRERKGDPLVSPAAVDRWMSLLPMETRVAVEAVRESRWDPRAEVWQEPLGSKLVVLAKCVFNDDFPIDQLRPDIGEDPRFWAFVEALPATEKLLRRLWEMPADWRAVFGLCSTEEWRKVVLGDRHGERLHRLRRCCSPTS